jgi:hypothetical protein
MFNPMGAKETRKRMRKETEQEKKNNNKKISIIFL